MLFKKKKKATLWTKKAADMTVLDGIKLTFIGMAISLLPLGIIGIGETVKEKKAEKERRKREQKQLEDIMNGREDSDTTW